MKRDVYIWKETYTYANRPIKEIINKYESTTWSPPFFVGNRSMCMKRDLHI